MGNRRNENSKVQTLPKYRYGQIQKHIIRKIKMSDFFNSPVVRDTVMELAEMQHKLVLQMSTLPIMSVEQRKSHLQEMKVFLEKQKLFFFRMSLVEDKEVDMIKKKLIESAKMFGYDEIDDMNKFFDRLDKTISEIESSIDKC